MMGKYTKGPWDIHPKNPELYSGAVHMFSGSVYIGTVTNSDMQMGEIIANAQLIAAAPDLLNALKSIVDSGEIPYCESDPLVKQAILAIEKAIGSNDGSRYKALGNSWAVPVVRWIGERIAKEVGK